MGTPLESAARSYTMGEVCELFGLRPHTIRYWERAAPIVAARRNAFGRRVFGAREVSLLYRLRHLIVDAGLPAREAAEALWRELSDDEQQDARGAIVKMRADLLDARNRVRRRLAATQRRATGEQRPAPRSRGGKDTRHGSA